MRMPLIPPWTVWLAPVVAALVALPGVTLSHRITHLETLMERISCISGLVEEM